MIAYLSSRDKKTGSDTKIALALYPTLPAAFLAASSIHEELADRGYVLENGRIVTSGTGAELLNSPSIKKAYLGG